MNLISTEILCCETTCFTKSDQRKISPAASLENITSHSMENLTLYSLLRWKMIVLPGWENVLFELESKRVK